jgi:hypothetical protein
MTRPRHSLALVGLLFACTDEPTPAPDPVAVVQQAPAQSEAPANPEPPVDPERRRATAALAMLDTVDALAELHRRHAADCPALARAITDFHAQHAVALAEVPGDVLAHVDADEALRARMRVAMESVMSASMACRDDPAFVAAGDALFGGNPK